MELILYGHNYFTTNQGHEIKLIADESTGTYGLERTGQVLWDGSSLLAKYIETRLAQDCQKGCKIIELGAGICGLPGQVAAIYGANVILTDTQLEVPFLNRSIEVNRHLYSGSITAQCLDWTMDLSGEEWGNIDVILCSDLVFGDVYHDLANILLKLLDLNPHAVILMSNTNRIQVHKFKRSEGINQLSFENLQVEDIITELNLSPNQIVWKIVRPEIMSVSS